MSEMQERELWGVAVFRLRESANRIFSLATRVRSLEVRGQLLRIYEQLRAEEAKLAALADAAEQMAENAKLARDKEPNTAAQWCTAANGEADD